MINYDDDDDDDEFPTSEKEPLCLEVASQQLCPRLAYLNECDGSDGEPRSPVWRAGLAAENMTR